MIKFFYTPHYEDLLAWHLCLGLNIEEILLILILSLRMQQLYEELRM